MVFGPQKFGMGSLLPRYKSLCSLMIMLRLYLETAFSFRGRHIRVVS